MEEILRAGFAELGLPLDAEALRRFRAYYEYLTQRNREMNLTAIAGEEQGLSGNGRILILAIGRKQNGIPRGHAQGEHAQQALGVDAAILLFHPDRAFILIGLLNEEGRGTGMKAH